MKTLVAALLAGSLLMGTAPASAQEKTPPRFLDRFRSHLTDSWPGGELPLLGYAGGVTLGLSGIIDTVTTLAAGAGIAAALPYLATVAAGAVVLYGTYRFVQWIEDGPIDDDETGANLPRGAPSAALPGPVVAGATGGIGQTR